MAGCCHFIATAALAAIVLAGAARAQPLDETIDNAETRGIEIALGLQEARRLFVCQTRMSFGPGHGTQVSYMHPDGAIFLWYPGNAVIVPGKWQIVPRTTTAQPAEESASICFQYGSNTYNPVTGQFGGKWECRPADVFDRSTVDRAEGDVFALATRTAVPFRLARERTTIAELKKYLEFLHGKEGQSVSRPDIGCTKGEVKLDWMRDG